MIHCSYAHRDPNLHTVGDPDDCTIFYKCVRIPHSDPPEYVGAMFVCPEGTGFDEELGL